jgi:hypothetical protein
MLDNCGLTDACWLCAGQALRRRWISYTGTRWGEATFGSPGGGAPAQRYELIIRSASLVDISDGCAGVWIQSAPEVLSAAFDRVMCMYFYFANLIVWPYKQKQKRDQRQSNVQGRPQTIDQKGLREPWKSVKQYKSPLDLQAIDNKSSWSS